MLYSQQIKHLGKITFRKIKLFQLTNVAVGHVSAPRGCCNEHSRADDAHGLCFTALVTVISSRARNALSGGFTELCTNRAVSWRERHSLHLLH